jgi:hypothetical protein
VIARLLGCPGPEPAALGLGRAACWQTDTLGANLMALQTYSRHAWIQADIRGLAERLEELRSGRIPPRQIETALRLARLDALLRLDSADAIATALIAYPLNPWDLVPDLTPETLRASWPALKELRLNDVLLSGGNVDDALANEVRAILEPFSKPQQE